VSADPVLSRELKSLQDELSVSQRQRVQTSPVAGAADTIETAVPSARLEESAEEEVLRGQLQDLIKEITEFVDDAEKNISAHPAMSVIAAMLSGILIGSLLTRRSSHR